MAKSNSTKDESFSRGSGGEAALAAFRNPPRIPSHTLQAGADDAILKIARALARQAAREDHARQQAESASHDKTCRNLREVLNRSAK